MKIHTDRTVDKRALQEIVPTAAHQHRRQHLGYKKAVLAQQGKQSIQTGSMLHPFGKEVGPPCVQQYASSPDQQILEDYATLVQAAGLEGPFVIDHTVQHRPAERAGKGGIDIAERTQVKQEESDGKVQYRGQLGRTLGAQENEKTAFAFREGTYDPLYPYRHRTDNKSMKL